MKEQREVEKSKEKHKHKRGNLFPLKRGFHLNVYIPLTECDDDIPPTLTPYACKVS